MTKKPRPTPAITCIIARNPLAAKYLLLLLATDSNLTPMLFEEFVRQSPETMSPVFVLDGSLPVLPLSECVQRLQSRYHEARYVLVDAPRPENECARLLFLGIHGFVENHAVAKSLHGAVLAVAAGRLWFSEKVLEIYVKSTSPQGRSRPELPAATTRRESQILELVQNRFSNKEIANLLNIRESTIKFHLSNLFGKLQVVNRQELLVADDSLAIWKQMLH